MRSVLITIGGFIVGSVVLSLIGDMCKEEVRARIERLPFALLRLAAYWLPRSVRGDLSAEWSAELDYILHEAEGLPITRLLRGVCYSTDLMLRGARSVAQEIDTHRTRASRVCAGRQRSTWSDLFPAGREIFYEGNDPIGFVQDVRTEFGFDPSRDPRWGVRIELSGDSFISYCFHCPPEHLDEIYGTDRFPMGS